MRSGLVATSVVVAITVESEWKERSEDVGIFGDVEDEMRATESNSTFRKR